MIEIKHEYWEHNGGTNKFYEMVMFLDKDTNSSLLVKRWGSASLKHGGGQTKIERFGTESELFAEVNKIAASKKRPNRSGGWYETVPIPSGAFYGGSSKRVEVDRLADLISKHYSLSDRRSIMDFFGRSADAAEMMEDIQIDELSPETEEKVASTPAHADWGSW